jgi:protein gp37
VWLGTSVEDQASANERIPHLLRCSAAVRWVSYEPALEEVDFGAPYCDACCVQAEHDNGDTRCPACGDFVDDPLHGFSLDWIVVGGESGPGARPFDVSWARAVIRQGREADVPVFVKQLGARPRDGGDVPQLRDRKGGDMNEWPADLRVRQWPEVAR